MLYISFLILEEGIENIILDNSNFNIRNNNVTFST